MQLVDCNTQGQRSLGTCFYPDFYLTTLFYHLLSHALYTFTVLFRLIFCLPVLNYGGRLD